VWRANYIEKVAWWYPHSWCDRVDGVSKKQNAGFDIVSECYETFVSSEPCYSTVNRAAAYNAFRRVQ
jgi:hypothetical protein